MRETLSHLLSRHVPLSSRSYCLVLWERYPFTLTLKKNRVTKVGDITFKRGQLPHITLNDDLNPYLFLITYVHEIAHGKVHDLWKNTVRPHGKEWQQAFRELMMPLMDDTIFPLSLLKEVRHHMIAPRASPFSDRALIRLLRTYDQQQYRSKVPLSMLAKGTVFALRGKCFKKIKLRRTWVTCMELASKTNYLVPADLPVEKRLPFGTQRGIQLRLF